MRKSIKTLVGGNGLKTRRSGERVDTDLCAAFSNRELRDNGYMISGNAWNLNDADILYSGYDGLTKPESYNRSAIQLYNDLASNNILKNFDSNTLLDKDSVYAVNMYYRGSPALETAYKEGRDNMTGTHTGYLLFNPTTNRWEVTHNIHGTLVVSPFTLILGGGKQYGVTAILSPRKDNLINKARHFFGFRDGGQFERKELKNIVSKAAFGTKVVNPFEIVEVPNIFETSLNNSTLGTIEQIMKNSEDIFSKYKPILTLNNTLVTELQIPILLPIIQQFPTLQLQISNGIPKDNDQTSNPYINNLDKSIKKYLGIPYVWGGTTDKGFDCSGFTRRVFKDMGINLRGNAVTLWHDTTHVNLKDAKVGDLIFLKGTIEGRNPNSASHVAIITDLSNLKNGKIQVAEASGRGKNSAIRTWDVSDKGWWGKRLLGVGRVNV